MTRLDALVAALPKILPVVENIADDVFRDRVFDALVEAATADAASNALVEAASNDLATGVISHNEAAARLGYDGAGTVYGNPVTVAPTDTPTQRTFNLQPESAGLDERRITAPAVVDLDNGQRLTGTYTGDAQSGTFTPDVHDPAVWAHAAGGPANAPSDVPTYDSVQRDRP